MALVLRSCFSYIRLALSMIACVCIHVACFYGPSNSCGPSVNAAIYTL